MPPTRKAAQVAKGTYDDAQADHLTSPSGPSPPGPPPHPKKPKPKASASASTKTTSRQSQIHGLSQNHRQNQRQNDRNNAHDELNDDLNPPSSLGPETQAFNQAITAFQKPAYSTRSDWLPRFSKLVAEKRADVEEGFVKGDAERQKKNAHFTKAFNDQIAAILKTPTAESTAPTSNGSKSNVTQSTNENTKKGSIATGKVSDMKGTGKAPATTHDPFTPHPLYITSNAWLNLCAHALSTYSSTCKIVEDAAPTFKLGEKWQEESDQLCEILEVGRRVVERRVGGMMGTKGWEGVSEREGVGEGVDGEGDVEMRVGGEGDVEMMKARKAVEEKENRMATDLLGLSMREMAGGEGQGTWADNVRYAESGVRRMVRGLPREVNV